MKVLIVSPHFPPTNAADMQRVRMVLPYLAEAGIEAEVLAVEPGQIAAPKDPWLVEGLPENIPVHRVKALGLQWSKIPGLGTLSWRAKGALEQKGNELLANGDFDLVYFSTTQFGTHLIGPAWKKRHGVPFTMDYQDPWVSDYYRTHPYIVPPGGRFKYGIVDKLNRLHEPRVLQHCSGFTAVSPAYPKTILSRYSLNLPTLVLPFPGDRADLERVENSNIQQDIFDPEDGFNHWVYVGRGGGDMALATRALFKAISSYAEKDTLRLHFIGTSYAAAGTGTKTIEPLAAEFGIEDLVREHPDRIPYSSTLRCLLDARALIVPGSDDPAYTASKIYPYLLAKKPMLAIFHRESSVTALIKEVGGGSVVPFDESSSTDQWAKDIHKTFVPGGTLKKIDLNPAAFTPYNARSQAEKLSTFFQQCLK